MLIGVRGILGIFWNFRDFWIFWIFEPPGSPNRLKMMPRGVGSISTPADFLSGIFEISKFSVVLPRGPQNLGPGVLNILGLGVLNRNWGPRHF